MKFKLEIEMDNDAFNADMGEEFNQCLSQVAWNNQMLYWEGAGKQKHPIKDSNGNTVGFYEVLF